MTEKQQQAGVSKKKASELFVLATFVFCASVFATWAGVVPLAVLAALAGFVILFAAYRQRSRSAD